MHEKYQKKQDPPHSHDREKVNHSDRPYWQRAHHDWKFWVAIVLMLVAIGIYVGTVDLAFGARGQTQKIIP